MAIIQDFLSSTYGPSIAGTGAAGIITYVVYRYWQHRKQDRKRTVPVSVNYHFTRKCNKECRK
jgi:hypothetical protein